MSATLHLDDNESARIRDLLAETYEQNLEYIRKPWNYDLDDQEVKAYQDLNATYRRSYELLISQGIPRIPNHPINQH